MEAAVDSPIPDGHETAREFKPPANDVIAALLDEYRDVQQGLRAQKSLTPGPALEHWMSRLMELSLAEVEDEGDAFFASAEVHRSLLEVRTISAEAEVHRERQWAERILNSEDPWRKLQEAPFYDNYVRLTRYELAALSCLDAPGGRTLIVGSGPMPASAILHARRTGSPVDGLDVDPIACELAQRMCDRLDGVGGSRTYCADISDFDRVADYRVVVLAASVGLSKPTRRNIIQILGPRMAAGGVLLVRTVHGMRRILFPEIGRADVEGFTVDSLIRPLNRVVNSVVVAQR